MEKKKKAGHYFTTRKRRCSGGAFLRPRKKVWKKAKEKPKKTEGEKK